MKIKLLEEKLAQLEISVKTAASFKRGDLNGYANGVTFYRDRWSVSLGCGVNNTCFQIKVGYGDMDIVNYSLSSSTEGGPICDDALVRNVVTTVSKAIDGSNTLYTNMKPDEFWGAFYDSRSRDGFMLNKNFRDYLVAELDKLGLRQVEL